ncbi:hypothetical protein AB4Z54_00095 [Streptomyces sp. MCAF7]
MTSLTPPCPECATATEPLTVEGEDVFRCPAPGCGRRTYGMGDPDDDDNLSPYSETDEDGAVVIYRGNGEIDVEATAENAAQEEPGEDDDLVDEEQPDPAAVVRGPGSPAWWPRFPEFEDAPARKDPTTPLTYSDEEVVDEDPAPQQFPMGHEQPAPFPAPPGGERMTPPSGEQDRAPGATVPRSCTGEGIPVPHPLDPDTGERVGEPAPVPSGETVPWAALLADGETVARYWSHVLRRGPGECWWWTGGLTDTAHATFRAGSHSRGTSRVVPAHLFGFRLANGVDSLSGGLVVRHTCDEPPCQNPAHWLAGTRGDNNRDAASRRRLAGHALADVRGAARRARAVQTAIAAARPEELDAAIAAALAAGNPSGAHQDALF